ncbi:type II secretion system protein GspG [Prosthecobacter sp. SYSU 5D2]|uniref:type II secretion system protein GspG n=1 Tax=Prosthecobacter sp. SYSU 5D2 TaxID=3134134 RepID=UPI0031FEBD77
MTNDESRKEEVNGEPDESGSSSFGIQTSSGYVTEESSNPDKRGVNRTNRLIRVFLWLAILFLIVVVLIRPIGPPPEGAAEASAAEAQMNTIAVALTQYKTLNRTLPTTEEGLAALVQPPANARSQKKLAEAAALRDPWGNPYLYRHPAVRTDRPFDLWSSGPDGKDGTEDDVWGWK